MGVGADGQPVVNPISDPARTERLRDPLQQVRRSRMDTKSLELIEHQFDDDHVTLSELVLHDEVLILRRIAVGVLLAFVVWTYIYGIVEMDWDFTNSTFMGAMTLTTVGYGELVPRNHFQRIVTTYYMWICVAIAATALSFIAAIAMDDKSEAISSALRSLEYCGAPTAEADEHEADVRSANETGRAYLLGTRTLRRRRVAVRVARRRIKFAAAFAVVVLLLGALVMLFLEPAVRATRRRRSASLPARRLSRRRVSPPPRALTTSRASSSGTTSTVCTGRPRR